jgi:hypothetical protein
MNRVSKRLSALFESWHVPDGNYPPLTKGDLVNLSFEVQQVEFHRVDHEPCRFENSDDGTCSFVAEVVRHYPSGDGPSIAVMDAGIFRFYVHGKGVEGLREHDRVAGNGELALDHYLWVEFLDQYANPPDIFYTLRVSRIRKIRIPERFVQRHDGGKALPTSVKPGEYLPEDVTELDTMAGQDFDEEFYIIEFDSAGLENECVAHTFC